MLRATIRLNETRTATADGEGLEAIRGQLEVQRPAGFELIHAPVVMAKASTEVSAQGTYARRDELRVIEGETMTDLRALVPDGWQMLHVTRTVSADA